jgi:hypothetical protein
LTVPGGDFRHVFEIEVPPDAEQPYAFTNPDSPDITYMIAYLDQPETVIRVHAEKRSVRVRVYAGDKPLAGAIFSGGMNLGVCGAGWGQVAPSDATGNAIIELFYPVENEVLCIATENEILWSANAKDLTADLTEIRLPATARERPTKVAACP